MVTIGNVDLVFTGGTLVRGSETQAATRTGGLEVRGLTWTIEGNKTLLNNISIDARPGTLTAVIGPSGAGKSTFAKQVAGLTHPTSGTVSFEGHDIHAEYASLRSRIGMVPQDDVVHGQLTVKQALMAATLAAGETELVNAAREPEVGDLAHLLVGSEGTLAATTAVTSHGSRATAKVSARIERT